MYHLQHTFNNLLKQITYTKCSSTTQTLRNPKVHAKSYTIVKPQMLALPLRFTLILFLSTLITTTRLYAQTPITNLAKPSKITVMVETLLSNNLEAARRKAIADALLADPKAHPALIKVLNGDDHITAKIIICQSIALQNDSFLPLQNQSGFDQSFIDPLFKALFSKNTDLSLAAAHALVKCRDGVTTRLGKIVTDQKQPVQYRLAAITALELIPGKASLMPLAKLLTDTNPIVQKKAAHAINTMLYLPDPPNIDLLTKKYLPNLKKISEKDFLLWQLQQRKAQLQNEQNDIQKLQKNITQLRQQHIKALGIIFDNLKTPAEKLKTLKQYLNTKQPDYLRDWAMQQICTWSTTTSASSSTTAQELVNLLSTLISDKDPKVRQLTAIALSQLDFDKALPTAGKLLEQLSKEHDPTTQADILSCLGTFEYVPAIDQALALLTDTTSSSKAKPNATTPQKPTTQAIVAQAAAQALGKIASSSTDDITKEQANKIAKQLAQAYHKWQNSPPVIREIILAMKKIASQPKYHAQAIKFFDKILRQALNSNDATIRSQAVYALTELYQDKILALLQKKSMLNDKDPLVRHAVIAAMEQYGKANQLIQLQQRLETETDMDVRDRIINAFGKILGTLSTEQAYLWANNLSGKGKNAALKSLKQQAVRILWDKISKAQANGTKVNWKYNQLAWENLGDFALANDLPDQALRWYNKLLTLPVSQQKKDDYRLKIINIALNSDDNNLLSAAQPVVLSSQPKLNLALNIIAQYIDKLDLTNQQQLIRYASILTKLIIPLKKYPSEQVKTQWQLRIKKAAISLIALLQTQLNKKIDTDPQSLQLLTDLLKAPNLLPTNIDRSDIGSLLNGTPKQQIAILKKYNKLLKKPITPPTPKNQTKSNTTKPNNNKSNNTQPNTNKTDTGKANITKPTNKTKPNTGKHNTTKPNAI